MKNWSWNSFIRKLGPLGAKLQSNPVTIDENERIKREQHLRDIIEQLKLRVSTLKQRRQLDQSKIETLRTKNIQLREKVHQLYERNTDYAERLKNRT